MSKYFRYSLLILMLVATSCSKVAAPPSHGKALHEKLDSIAADSGGRGVLKYLRTSAPTSPEEQVDFQLAVMDWLQERELKLDPDPVYSLIYSDLLFSAAKLSEISGVQSGHYVGLYSNGYLQLRIFELVSFIDAARCSDASVSERLLEPLRTRHNAFNEVKKQFGPQEWEILDNAPFKYERLVANRPPNKELCKSGIQAMTAALEQKNVDIKEINSPSHVGQSYQVTPSPDYQPQFVSDVEWKERSEAIKNKIKERWAREHSPIP